MSVLQVQEAIAVYVDHVLTQNMIYIVLYGSIVYVYLASKMCHMAVMSLFSRHTDDSKRFADP